MIEKRNFYCSNCLRSTKFLNLDKYHLCIVCNKRLYKKEVYGEVKHIPNKDETRLS